MDLKVYLLVHYSAIHLAEYILPQPQLNNIQGASTMNISNKTLALALTISLGIAASLPSPAQANSGGFFVENTYTNKYDYYAGANNVTSASDGNTILDNAEGKAIGWVYGGYSDTADVSNNRLFISAADPNSNLDIMRGYGGYSEDGAAKYNTLTLDANVKAIIANGGHSSNSDAVANTLNIYGSVGIARGGFSYTGDVVANTLNLYGIAEMAMAGSNGSGDVRGNTLNIYIGSSVNNAIGGEADSGNATGNTVNIIGGTVNTEVFGGKSFSGNANNNTVIINGGTINGEISGGYSHDSESSGNTVIINGGTILCDSISGGKILNNGIDNNNNTVTINGGTLNGVSIYGILMGFGSGNTLNWAHQAKIGRVAGFNNYNFYIPYSANPSETLLTVDDSFETELTDTDVKLAGINGSRKWVAGDSIILLDNQKGIGGVNNNLEGSFDRKLKRYQYEIEKIDGDTKLQATITATKVFDQAKSLSEGRIASIGFINSAADLATGAALSNALSSGASYELFGATSYSDSKYQSGSHSDVKGSSFLLGFARNIESANSKWTVGAFLESGNSSYETFNSFADAVDIRASGKNNYLGVGIMGRNTQESGVYYEGSLRLGRMSSDYNSSDLDVRYDTKSTYYGAHLGIGKVIKINASNDLDVYGKYYWAHQNSATADIDGEEFKFDALNSHRLRVGARLNMAGGGYGIKTYVGLAYEHELGGSAAATYSSESIAAPSIKGGTGIGEIGMVYKPSGKSAFSMDVGLNGFVGKRQGIGGGFKLNWGF